VPRIGITGHTNLTDSTIPLVAAAIRAELAPYAAAGIVGVTCLARGADQVFARVVLALSGSVEVVLPAVDYRDRKVEPDNAAEFDDLLARADTVRTMPFDTSGPEAYLAASERMIDTVDRLIAVWDGAGAQGLGGTADVVLAARKRSVPVVVVWPDGAEREQ
jgi:hypothetical protein